MFLVGPLLLSSGAHFCGERREEGEDAALGPRKLTVSKGLGVLLPTPSFFSSLPSPCPHPFVPA